MNKTLLLIICDFLLLNLLALTRWESAEPPRPQQTPVPVVNSGAGASSKDQDMVEVMKLSLEDERAQREQLSHELQSIQSNLQQREQNLASLESERSKLASSLNETQRGAQEMAQRYESASREAQMSKERLAQLQRDLEQRQTEAEKQQQQLAQLEKAQSEARERIESLNVKVKVAEQEKQILQETAASYKTQAEQERQERQKVFETTKELSQGVGQLAQQSNQLTSEIRDNRPINANTLFNEFLANRVQTTFTAGRQALIGSGNRTKEARTVFVADGKQTYALVHVDDTPFYLRDHTPDWERLQITFSKGNYRSDAPDMRFLSADPRIIVIPIDDAQVKALGVKVYQTALEPFKFPEAVLISNGGAGYGEVAFKLDPQEPSYVRMDNRLMKRLFGDFATSSGDLVLSKTGELLGIMVNRDYCLVINNFLPSKTLRTGDNIVDQHTGVVFDDLAQRLFRKPLKLQ